MDIADSDETPVDDAKRFQLLVEAVVDYAIYMLDPNGFIASWNPGAQRFKGYEAKEILGHHFSSFYTEEDRRAGLPQRALESAATEGRFENEGWRVRKDGSQFWAHVVIDPIRGPEGQLIGFAKITRDLTERKIAEDALRTSQQQLRLLVDGVTDYAIYMLDPDGRITSWNSGAQRIKGYLPDEIIGDHFSRFYTAEDRESGEPQKVLDAAAGEGRFENEARRVRKDGSQFWANVVIDAIRDEQGRLIGFAKVTRDITERKRLQAELLQSSKMATLGTLAAGIAHELNQPLNIVRMWAENGLTNVRSGAPDLGRLERTLTLAIEQTQRMAAIIGHMRTFSRAEPGTMDDFDPAQSLRAAVEMVERQYALQDVAVDADLSEGLCEVHGSAVQLEQVVLNFLSNARDAIISKRRTEEGAAGAIIAGMTFDRDTGRATITVADNGGGVPEEMLERIFDPFFTTKEVGEGTGLGLAVSYGIIQAMGGSLDVSNVIRPDGQRGACFAISLPARPIEPELLRQHTVDGSAG